MRRVLGVAVVMLAMVVVIQATALRRIRAELAGARAWAVASDLEVKRDEVVRAGQWLHGWLQSSEGGAQAGGLCPEGAPDVDRIRGLILGTYLRSRASGASEPEARQAVVAQAGK